jgi:CHAD domain-containing protein
MDIWTLDNNNDEVIDEVISLLRMSLGAAREAEVIHPETESALRAWCNAETKRIHPRLTERRLSPEQEIMEGLRRSKWWRFWESLEKDQEVRWTGTKSQTYFVVDPTPTFEPPDIKERRGPVGMYIELRRHTGKTFWTHIGQVRPLEVSDE